jgi:hypothetical protein
LSSGYASSSRDLRQAASARRPSSLRIAAATNAARSAPAAARWNAADRRRRRQPEPRLGHQHLEDVGRAAGAAVVRLVDDDQPEAVADPRRPADRAGVGGDRHRADDPGAVAEPADVLDVPGEHLGPLIEQHPRRYQAQRRDPTGGDRGHRHHRLAGPGRERDHPAALGGGPRFERRALIPAQVGHRPSRGPTSRTDRRRARLAARRLEPRHDRRVRVGRRSPHTHARIPHHAGQRRRIDDPRPAGDHDRPAIETDLHARRA